MFLSIIFSLEKKYNRGDIIKICNLYLNIESNLIKLKAYHEILVWKLYT